MKNKIIITSIKILLFTIAGFFVFAKNEDDRFVVYQVDAKKQDVRLYWKDTKGNRFGSIANLISWLNANNKQLLFAMNAGMYKPDRSPQGLYMENGKTLSPLDTSNGVGNFYLKPNGVFYIKSNKEAAICRTIDFTNDGNIKYATQSGPMLVINGWINPAFKQGSANLNIRNGAGLLPDGKLVFVLSKKEISFYDFADYFKSLGCKNALYLDGLVSRTYLPQQHWIQTDGDFGVMIGVTKNDQQ